MNYVSTRNSSDSFKFEDVFIKGLADDGGLFIPKSLHKYKHDDLLELKNLKYTELAKKITANISNNHKKYAITWFSLAISILLLYLYFRKKNY